MPFVFAAPYHMEFNESAPLEVERFPLLSFQFLNFITLQKSSKGQSFITRLSFTGEKNAERLTLSMYLDVRDPSHRFFGYAPFKYYLWTEGATTILMDHSLYKLAQMDVEGHIPDNRRMSLETSVFKTLKWSIHTLLRAVRKMVAFYSLQHCPLLAGLLFRLSYYRIIFSNGYPSYLRYMKFIDNTDLMLDERHNVLGYNVVMEILEEIEEDKEEEEDEDEKDEED
ncbi:hypothetical protein BXZ70DRAFT_911753 [Cristinia sonorae]|uniref:Uncharacterized protein n=1 Tax=Cristinia sonorae TaxID=1940300 RepID=A0A8K0UDK9_9AGAR|nr:hypothetical protein BXZ70DRAFT_911753 [Cristinia sonorae]